MSGRARSQRPRGGSGARRRRPVAAYDPEPYRPEEVDRHLAPILDAIRSVYEPERVILYGSAAQGRPWRDLDLLVIAETQDRFYERLRKLASPLAAIRHVPTDIVVLTPRELEKALREERFFVAEEILQKGKTVYERA
ncbi:MAG TPA: nucleotidyltransferase domain-containing protein [Dehalococcoidia bacterium]|nr:nucleotidyltransferase domain-containing protein [Dehalococcoidia bacterium]